MRLFSPPLTPLHLCTSHRAGRERFVAASRAKHSPLWGKTYGKLAASLRALCQGWVVPSCLHNCRQEWHFKMTVSFKSRNRPCLYGFLCPCPKSSFHTLTAVTPNRSTSASSSATLLSAKGKLWRSHSFWKGHLLCQSSLKISWFAICDPQNPNPAGRWELLHKKKELMGPSLFLNSFLHSLPKSLFQVSPGFLQRQLVTFVTLKTWPLGIFGQEKEFKSWHPEPHQPLSGSRSAGEIPPFMGSFSNRRQAGMARAQLHSWHVAAGGRSVPGMFKRSWRHRWGHGSCRDPGTLTLSYCCFQQSLSTASFASNIWESLCCLLMAIKGIPVPIFEPGALIHYWLYISAGFYGQDIIYANQSTCFGKKKEEKWLLREKR